MSKTMPLNASARILAKEAEQRGYSIERFYDKHLLKITKGDAWVYTRGSRHSKQSSVGMTIADYKGLTRQIVTAINPQLMAEGGHFMDVEGGVAFANRVGYPIVYKPSASRHGKGVVVGIEDEARLRRVIGEKVDYRGYILEKPLVGNDYRILVIGYRMVAAAHRLPAFVEGDGKQSIAKLVDEENKNPDRTEGHQGNLTTMKIDELVLGYLEEQGRSLDSVPEKGERVFLRKTAGLSTGGVGIDVTDEVGEKNKMLFEKIARAADLSTVGIDVMADNLREPITEQARAGMLELNASPGLRMHHFPYKGKSRNVAGEILDYVFGG